MSILAKISEIESEMARTQKQSHNGSYRYAKSTYSEAATRIDNTKGGSSSSGEGFDVAKTGDARIGFVENITCRKRQPIILYIKMTIFAGNNISLLSVFIDVNYYYYYSGVKMSDV
ncbi:putative developmentally regulated GTP-binding protein 1 (Drg 1) [Dirofilaria immitis]|nr:putative developmentally regulated GTP-binding protein 1 (Drg 1) [Dirofilaria immitis]